jgi:citrate lyase subunit beta/citryl-CoA lyase
MLPRSWLFVPADSEKKLTKSELIAADVVILDLEDSVADANKQAARALCRAFLCERPGRRRSQLWVRINSLHDGPETTAQSRQDLEAVMDGRPDGIVLPKARSAADVNELGEQLAALESHCGIDPGSTRILPVATECPEAMFSLDSYMQCDPRLAGLTWGGEDLGAELGVLSNKDAAGNWTQPFQLTRSLCLFAAAAAGVAAVDTLHANFRDPKGLRLSCDEGRRDGFTGKLAIHPAQVEIINEAFTPSAEEVDHARRVVALFEANPGAGALAMDGMMLDMPHLKQARKIIELAATAHRDDGTGKTT